MLTNYYREVLYLYKNIREKLAIVEKIARL